jgi:hypothetical protein
MHFFYFVEIKFDIKYKVTLIKILDINKRKFMYLGDPF